MSAILLAAVPAWAQYDDEDNPKPLAPSCRPLLERIEKDAGNPDLVRKAIEAEDVDLGDLVIQVVPVRILDDSDAERLACWRQSRGRPDATTTDAIFTISRMQLRRVDHRIAQRRSIHFADLLGAFSAERATGVDGPISAYLRKSGFARLAQGDPDWEASNLTGFDYEPEYVEDLEAALVRLAALCLAHPKDFTAVRRSLEFKDAFLEPRPSRHVDRDGVDPVDPELLAYLDAERDRIVRACPT
ncbi:hypothetical protein QO010_001010 [Caulobacter ginsengisoli]|uniref:DUF4375 domain-containing protein n=1 Tax=Caulobacter ginsengisoli TaxID=400775 RepID=A0ABU0IQN6_9CAUL|nr:hypothetical protein [Caulobacter ginsengisoli]MDQ0463262.1 hypothetical protein [Caulobacter ginsengisoli]